jgi:hypothetical protein
MEHAHYKERMLKKTPHKDSLWPFIAFQVSDCSGMVLEEQPIKVAEAFRLFLQGMGYGKYTPKQF